MKNRDDAEKKADEPEITLEFMVLKNFNANKIILSENKRVAVPAKTNKIYLRLCRVDGKEYSWIYFARYEYKNEIKEWIFSEGLGEEEIQAEDYGVLVEYFSQKS